jgi:hypothetical protein
LHHKIKSLLQALAVAAVYDRRNFHAAKRENGAP